MSVPVYVACALTHAPEEYAKRIRSFKSILERREEVDVLKFIGLGNPDDGSVFRHDIERCVGRVRLIVAFCDYPSTGLGLELGAALWKYGWLNTKIILLIQEDTKLSQLIRDLRIVYPEQCELHTYKDMFADVTPIVLGHISGMTSKTP